MEHLPANQIHDWDDLVEMFVGNFQGTYLHPGTKWDLKRCHQKKDESLRDFIWQYSKHCTELPEGSEYDVIGIFTEVTTFSGLIHKLGRKRPNTIGQLFDIATKYASGDEAVAAMSTDTKGKRDEPSPAEGGGSANPPKKKKRARRARSNNGRSSW